MQAGVFERLRQRGLAYLQGRELFVCDAHACADDHFRLPVRVVADRAWHALLATCLFRSPLGPSAPPLAPDSLTVLCASGMRADPEIDGTRSEAFIVLHLARRLVLIGGAGAAGGGEEAGCPGPPHCPPSAG